jgi:hypothetical protein
MYMIEPKNAFDVALLPYAVAIIAIELIPRPAGRVKP